VCTCPL